MGRLHWGGAPGESVVGDLTARQTPRYLLTNYAAAKWMRQFVKAMLPCKTVIGGPSADVADRNLFGNRNARWIPRIERSTCAPSDELERSYQPQSVATPAGTHNPAAHNTHARSRARGGHPALEIDGVEFHPLSPTNRSTTRWLCAKTRSAYVIGDCRSQASLCTLLTHSRRVRAVSACLMQWSWSCGGRSTTL